MDFQNDIVGQVTLTTDRLILRELVNADAKALVDVFGDPDVVAFTEWETFTEVDQAERLIGWASRGAQEVPRTVFAFAISLPSDDGHPSRGGTLIGVSTLIVRDTGCRDAALGFLLGRSQWGRGFATEAARALVAYGFKHLGLHRIHALSRPANTASARVLEKLGMRREAHLRRNLWQKNAWHDTVVHAVATDALPRGAGK